jgi:2,3-bisphosphoglycerate-dependent phosphoglycerate mutase
VTILAFVRHGETDWNRERRAQGQRDIPLNEAGRRQAEVLAERFGNESWDMVYTSDLSRARETAEAIGRRLSIPVHSDNRLREIGFGRLEGTTIEERVVRWGGLWKEMDFGEEPISDIRARSSSFVQHVLDNHKGQRIAAVSHGAFIADTLRMITGDSTISHLGNTSVTILKYEDNQWVCELLNCSTHLELRPG